MRRRDLYKLPLVLGATALGFALIKPKYSLIKITIRDFKIMSEIRSGKLAPLWAVVPAGHRLWNVEGHQVFEARNSNGGLRAIMLAYALDDAALKVIEASPTGNFDELMTEERFI